MSKIDWVKYGYRRNKRLAELAEGVPDERFNDAMKVALMRVKAGLGTLAQCLAYVLSMEEVGR